MKVSTIIFLCIVAVSTVQGHSKDSSENPLAFLQAELDPLVSFILKNYDSHWNYAVYGEIPHESVSIKKYLKGIKDIKKLTLKDVVSETLKIVGIEFDKTSIKNLNAGFKNLPIDVKAFEEALEVAFPKGTKKVAYKELVFTVQAFLIKIQTPFITKKLSELLF